MIVNKLTKLIVCTTVIGITGYIFTAIPVQSLPKTARQQTKILYVNPYLGKDNIQSGTNETNPLKSITYAMQKAMPGTIIQLAPGEYSSAERFPIILRADVTLKGNDRNYGKSVKIKGGGTYLSKSFAGQNVAIVTENNTQISGVTISNENMRGTGIWIESNNAKISNSSLTQNHREGIFIAGTATPTITNNQIVYNRGNGLSITSASSGIISNNYFAQTGVAINIGGEANPQIFANKIINNRHGILITDKSQPVIENNVITNNTQYGIFITEQTTAKISNNTLKGNRID
ncbi:MAG TPA: DUF1565 domain-containing protein, partial [Allocoleopsis sp.]